jgi:hypothetical protein
MAAARVVRPSWVDTNAKKFTAFQETKGFTRAAIAANNPPLRHRARINFFDLSKSRRFERR